MTASPIPTEALENHLAILAKTGAGKSNAAKTVVEGLADRGERVCVIDPTGTWYGIRLTPKKKPSGYDFPIFGGIHADLPIAAGHGGALAEMIGTSATSAIIDTRSMTVKDRTRFFTDFAEALLRTNKGALTLVIDEAHLFAPKGKVADPMSGMMVAAANNLVSLGRGIGLRIILISQRPAKVHNDCLAGVETLVAMRMILPHDRAAVMDWVKEQADPEKGKEIVSSLPGLKTGEAWIWSPGLDLLERRRFPLVKTYDSGRPPPPGEVGPKLPPLDMAAVTERLAQVGAEIIANDPAALKREVARLIKELAEKGATAAPDQTLLDDTYRRGLIEGEARGVVKGQAVMLTRCQGALNALRVDTEPSPAASPPAKAVAAPPPPRPSTARVQPATGITGPQQRILDALAWWCAFGIREPTNEQVGFIAGYSPGSGNFNNIRGGLRAAGLIDYPAGGKLSLTAGGEAAAAGPSVAPTTEGFHAQVRAKLNAPQVRLLDPALAVYPKAMTSDALAAEAGYSAGSGNFNNLRGSLKTIGLITYPSPGQVRAADWLFPEAR